MRRLISILFLFAVINIPQNVRSQISYGGIPASFGNLKKAKISFPFVEMERVSNYELLMLERNDDRIMKSFRFAKSFDVSINPENSGEWTESSDGTKIWRVGIRSRGAYSLNVIFDRYHIPDGAQLFIYTPDKDKILGAFNANNEKLSGDFAVRPIPGEEIIVEYNEPFDASFKGELNICSVNHDYKNAFGDRPLGESGLCNTDVYCPTAEVRKKEKQAVVRLIIRGEEICTGTLVNNSDEDKTPYLLTAGHCIEGGVDANRTIFYFNYESPDCGQGSGSLDGYVDQTLSGATLKARSDSLDFALIELDDIPPHDYRPYYVGWDRTENIPSSTSSVHHPQGDVKKVAFDNDPPSIGTYSSKFLPNAFWLIKEWDEGTTEEGSSGGALFNQDGLIVGTLTGGLASCINPVNDYFSMVNKQWDYYSNSAQQLKTWLDPVNSGVNSIQALDPYGEEEEVCDLFSNSKLGEKYILEQLSDGGYISGKNSLKADSYAERFDLNGMALVSAISFAVGKVERGANSGDIVFKIYEADKITGLPGFELASKSMPIQDLYSGSMFYLEFDNPVEVTDDYYIGYDIDYSFVKDSFAVMHSPDRFFIDENTAYVKMGGNWKSFSNVSQYDTHTSLLIKSHACGVVETNIPDTIISDTRYQVYYSDFGLTNYVYLRDTKEEGWANVTILDITGRMLIKEERYLSKDPILVSIGNHHSGIYFIEVVSNNEDIREVIKVQMHTGR
jgi:hypothetical protein